MNENQKMRGVFERPKGSGIWWINYYDGDGVRHREKIGREAVAQEAYLTRRMELKEGKFIAPRSGEGITFKEIAAERTALKTANLSPTSLRADKYRLPALIEEIGTVPARALSPQRIEAALNEIGRKRGVSGATLNRYRTLVQSICSVAVRNKHMQVNPIGQVTRRAEPSCRNRFLSDAEETKLRKQIRKSYPERVAEFDLALATGMRRAEEFNLTWAGVDLEQKQILVMGKGSRGRGPKRRFVPINEQALKSIKALYKISNGSPYVCPRKKKEGQRDFSKWFEETVTAAGIPDLHWHDLRHTFASRLVMSGVDIRTVGELLGHSSIQTTMRYAHLSQEHRHAAVGALDSWHQDGTKGKRTSRKVLQMQSNQHRRGTQEA
jgi:site-specific recombinase XerD